MFEDQSPQACKDNSLDSSFITLSFAALSLCDDDRLFKGNLGKIPLSLLPKYSYLEEDGNLMTLGSAQGVQRVSELLRALPEL